GRAGVASPHQAPPSRRRPPMTARSWFRSPFASRFPASSGRGSSRRRLRPTVTALEGRELLSTLIVSNINDSGTGSLRAAVAQANSDGGGDTIGFSSLFNTPQTITLTSGEL